MSVKKIRLLLLIFWLILAGLIVWLKVVPLGKATYHLSYPAKINILGGKGFIGNFTPADRVNIKDGKMAEIFGDPVYFSVFTPRTFSEAKITITYQDQLTTSTPVIEAGVLVDNIVWRYKLAPLENKILDNNFANWFKIKSGDTILLQKSKRFSTLEDFLKSDDICRDNNSKTCLVLYNKNFDKEISSQGAPEFKVIDTPLQGAHQFYFSANGDKTLKFSFDFVDLNLDRKDDPIIISIYQGEEKIYSTSILDTFGGDETGVVRNSSNQISHSLPEASKGLYKLEIKAGEDIIIKKITEAPSALSIISRLHPVTAANLPITVWTDSSFIKLTTDNPASCGAIIFGGQSFSLDDPYKQFEFVSHENGLKSVVLGKDDVILETNGVFSFSATDFSNPEFKKIDEHFVLSDDTTYILAEYESPKILDNNLKQATVILNTKEAYREKGKYSFMISVPGLSLAEQGSLKISDIKIEFSGRTLFDKIKEYVN